MNPGKGEGWGRRLSVPPHPTALWKPSVFPSWELEMLVGARTGALVVEVTTLSSFLSHPGPRASAPTGICQS